MSDRRPKMLLPALLALVLVGFVGVAYALGASTEPDDILARPSAAHWFGTDLAGKDVLHETLVATWIAVVTIVVVAVAVYIGGLAIGMAVTYTESRLLREVFLNAVHYWVSLPILLIATFVLILAGAGQGKLIMVLIFVLIPSQALYVYSQFNDASKQDFVLAKRSFGFSKVHIFLRELWPYVRHSTNIYILSRVPEILVMDVAFNFLGLGVQPPHSSVGSMLFNGLPFMFSAWWIWTCPVVMIGLAVIMMQWFSAGVHVIEGRSIHVEVT